MRLEKHLLELALAASALVHAGAVSVLPTPSPTASSVRAPVRFIAQRSAPPPAPEVDPEPAPPPPPEPPKPQRAAAQPKPAPVPTPASQLSGTTLTAPGDGPGFAVPEGDGSSRREPIASPMAPAPKPAPAAPAPPPPPVPPQPPEIVEQRDLSRRPEPPALASTLARHYPEDARRRGVGGQAVVRARVDADGKVRTASVLSETEPGFGRACQRTLVGSRWTAPLARDGRSVGTWVRYTCRFRVGL